MAFIIVCVDKEDPKNSEVVPAEDQVTDDESPDALVFESRAKADEWITEDEKEFPGTYDYHVLEV